MGVAPVRGQHRGSTPRGHRQHGSGGVLGLALLLVLAACASPVTPAAARRAVGAVPVPPGAVLVSEDSRFSPLEGPGSSKASRVYAVPVPVELACPTVLRLAMDAGYTAVPYGSGTVGARITDAAAACREAAPPPIMVIFPPGAEPQYASDGIAVVTAPPDPHGPYPAGSTMRVEL